MWKNVKEIGCFNWTVIYYSAFIGMVLLFIIGNKLCHSGSREFDLKEKENSVDINP
jgi:hypothetical protein